MTLGYAVCRNPLSDDRIKCIGRILHTGTLSREQLLDRVASRNTTVSRSDLFAAVEDYEQEIVDALRDGYRVRTGLVEFYLTIEGPFDGPLDTFDRARHKVRVRYRTGPRLLRAMRRFIPMEHALGPEPGPKPRMLADATTGAHPERITPGGIARLWGRALQFDPADPAQGIFFIAEDRRETRVEVVIWNKARQLFFQIPELPAGRYRLEVRAIPRNSRQPHAGRLDDQLSVD
jgi:hypothetical protein